MSAEAGRQPGGVPDDDVHVAQGERQTDAEDASHAAHDADEQFNGILREAVHAARVVHAAEAQAQMRDEAGDENGLEDQDLFDFYVACDRIDERGQQSAQHHREDVAERHDVGRDAAREASLVGASCACWLASPGRRLLRSTYSYLCSVEVVLIASRAGARRLHLSATV